MAEILSNYPESTISQICNSTTGMATNFKFLPSLAEFKEYCDKRSSEAVDHDRRVRDALKAKAQPPKPASRAGCYTGPIEHVKPGDILSWERYDEYREFMREKKGVRDTRLWWLHEDWKDNGARPFQLSGKPEANATATPQEPNPNPFER